MGLNIGFYITAERYETADAFYDSWQDSWDNCNSIAYLDGRWAIKEWIMKYVPDEDVLEHDDGDFLAYLNRHIMTDMVAEMIQSKPLRGTGAFSEYYYNICTEQVVENDVKVIAHIIGLIEEGQHVLCWLDW